MDDVSLVRRFMDADMQLTKDALDVLCRHGDKSAGERVLAGLKEMGRRPFLITADLVMRILGGDAETTFPTPSPAVKTGLPAEVTVPPGAKFEPGAAKLEPQVKVLKDVTGRSYTEGDVKDFANLFRNRYERLSDILKKRMDLFDAIPMSSLRSLEEGSPVKVVGIVYDKRETSGGHVVLEMEDLSGMATAWVFKGRRELMQKVAEVVLDEVVGIVGNLRIGDRAPRVFAKEIIWPDIPTTPEFRCAEDTVCAALISDLHVGSEMFLEDVFLKFVKWLHGGVGNAKQRELASRVKYLVVAGDVVDGVGVYPKQEEELLIDDVFRQYDAAAELLAQVPEHISIIVAPGNHDAVRPSEPQPAIPKDIAGALYDLNTVMVGNPAWVSLSGVKFLIYHGRSFDDMVAMMPNMSMQRPISPMIKLLQKRHLAPVYGGRTAISPEQEDYLLIDELPDVFQCGHAHVYGYERYRGIEVVNSGTFQARTAYIRRLGVEPTPGVVPILDLQTRKAVVMQFA